MIIFYETTNTTKKESEKSNYFPRFRFFRINVSTIFVDFIQNFNHVASLENDDEYYIGRKFTSALLFCQMKTILKQQLLVSVKIILLYS